MEKSESEPNNFLKKQTNKFNTQTSQEQNKSEKAIGEQLDKTEQNRAGKMLLIQLLKVLYVSSLVIEFHRII